MMLSKSTVKHVFRTLKHLMDWTHFLMRRKVNVASEMSLYVRAYNLKRVISILVVSGLITAMKTVGA